MSDRSHPDTTRVTAGKHSEKNRNEGQAWHKEGLDREIVAHRTHRTWQGSWHFWRRCTCAAFRPPDAHRPSVDTSQQMVALERWSEGHSDTLGRVNASQGRRSGSRWRRGRPSAREARPHSGCAASASPKSSGLAFHSTPFHFHSCTYGKGRRRRRPGGRPPPLGGGGLRARC